MPTPQKIEIKVTAEDIKNGVRGKCARCPVAQAVSRTLGEPGWASYASVGLLSRFDRMATPEKVALFIDRFDNQLPVKPFTFEFEVTA